VGGDSPAGESGMSLLNLHDRLLAFGGKNDMGQSNDHILEYDEAFGFFSGGKTLGTNRHSTVAIYL